jgi:mevalonate pyrophosphate decarboxylase
MVYKNFIKEFKYNLKNINFIIKPINPIFSKSFIYSKSNLHDYYYNCFLDNIKENFNDDNYNSNNDFEDIFDNNFDNNFD